MYPDDYESSTLVHSSGRKKKCKTLFLFPLFNRASKSKRAIYRFEREKWLSLGFLFPLKTANASLMGGLKGPFLSVWWLKKSSEGKNTSSYKKKKEKEMYQLNFSYLQDISTKIDF